MRKRIPSRLSFDLFPPVPEPRVYRYFENARENPFRPRASGVDLLNAWWLSELSMLAFSEPAFIDIALERAGLEPAGVFDGPSTEAFAVKGDGFAAIAFRGTQVFLPGRDPLTLLGEITEDILTDACIPLVAARKPARGRVHRGFRKALDEIWKPVAQLVAKLRKEDPDRAVWLTGHSLGGALAILAASRLPAVQGVYAFGAPLVGDAELRASLPVRPVRFVHGSDLVARVPVIAPNLPPRVKWTGLLPLLEPLGTYRPAGDTVAFNRAGHLVAHTDADGALQALKAELLRLGTSARDWALHQPLDDIIDHAPVYYAVHLWNLYEESLGRVAA